MPSISVDAEQDGSKQDDLPGEPVFIGEDGMLYDLHYRPIYADPTLLTERRGKLSKILDRYRSNRWVAQADAGETAVDGDVQDDSERLRREFEFVHDPELYASQPNPESFASFEGS